MSDHVSDRQQFEQSRLGCVGLVGLESLLEFVGELSVGAKVSGGIVVVGESVHEAPE